MSRKSMRGKEPQPKTLATDMRLDKFLKVSRLIKRRSVANDAASMGHVFVNDKEAKPGTAVKVGDIITVRFGEKRTSYEILSIAEHAMKQDAADMYRELR